MNENKQRIVRRSASSSKLIKLTEAFSIINMKPDTHADFPTKFKQTSTKNLLLSLKTSNNSKAPSPATLHRKKYKISSAPSELYTNYFKDPIYSKMSQYVDGSKTARGDIFKRKTAVAPNVKKQESQKNLLERSPISSMNNASRVTFRAMRPLEYSPVMNIRNKKINSFIYDIQPYYQERRTRCSHHENKNVSPFDNIGVKLQTVQPCLILATMDHKHILSTKQKDLFQSVQTITFSRSASMNTRRSSPKSSSKKLPTMV